MAWREVERGREAPTPAGGHPKGPRDAPVPHCHTWAQQSKGHLVSGLPVLWDRDIPCPPPPTRLHCGAFSPALRPPLPLGLS